MKTNFKLKITKAFGLAIGLDKTKTETHNYWNLDILILCFHFQWIFCKIHFK